MPTSISIRFLTGRAHLHPWDTHHSEGRVDWPPSPWRLLRALVAVAGRGLTTLPCWDDTPEPRPVAEASLPGVSSLSKSGVLEHTRGKLSSSKARAVLTLKEQLSDAEAEAWVRANPSPAFRAALDEVRRIASLPDPVALPDTDGDELPVSRLADLLTALAASPEIWLPTTSVGHTRHFFTIHEGGVTRTTGSAVFDTFAVVGRTAPILFCWPSLDLSRAPQQQGDLRLLFSRLSYFGRAESWCEAELCDGIRTDASEKRTHWRSLCWEDASPEARRVLGREHRDFTLERKLAPLPLEDHSLRNEAASLAPKLCAKPKRDTLAAALRTEGDGKTLLRCLLRESGQDMKDGLERPIGSRWVHYAVPRAIFDLPPRSPRKPSPICEEVHVVRYALNTATTHRPVLPRLTDALLIGDQFRRALMARHQVPSENFSGKTASGQRLQGHQHAFFLPGDEDLDGFIDHLTVWCPRGFTAREVRALRSLARLPQRGGRPPLLVTPTRVARQDECRDLPMFGSAATFESVTPYVPARHAFRRSGRLREEELPERQLVRDISTRLEALGQPPATIASLVFLGDTIEAADGHCIYRAGVIRLKEDRQAVRCLRFVQHRRGKGRRTGKLDHGQLGGSWRIEFAAPIRGPLALGYACHFGLGQFRPVL